jgi:pyridoxal phosphate enzyme (YggS family)
VLIYLDGTMSIASNIEEVEGRVVNACERAGRSPSEVTVIAVTKTVTAAVLREAYDHGVRDFGENRVQEAQPKIAEVSSLLSPAPVWHMIGHLQTNKAKTVVGIFDIIHSIDSLRLATAVNERLGDKRLPVLLEVNVAGEETKGGLAMSEVEAVLRQVSSLANLEVKGLMTIAPLVDDPEEVRPVFRALRQLRDALGLAHLSMGMTDDFEVAIEEGATMVRIGRAIFGERRY